MPQSPTPSERVEQADGYHSGPLSNTASLSLRRLELLEEVLDPHSAQVLGALDLGPAPRCLEIGAGAGSIARWLARRHPAGKVTATDIDIHLLTGDNPPNMAVLQHDVRHDEFPAASFDLVHCRAVLIHLLQREAMLAKISGWVALGGWLVIEEPVVMLSALKLFPSSRV